MLHFILRWRFTTWLSIFIIKVYPEEATLHLLSEETDENAWKDSQRVYLKIKIEKNCVLPKIRETQKHKEWVILNVTLSISILFTHLCIEHDLRCPVPARGHVLCQDPGVIMRRVTDTWQTKVTNFQVTVGIEENVRRLEVPMENIGGVDILQASQYLIEKVTNVIWRQFLWSQ